MFILYATTGSTAGAPQTVLCSVGNAASDIDPLRHSVILYTNSTVCIHLYDPKWSFSRTVKFSSNIFTGDEYLITNLVVIIYSKIIFPDIIFVNIFSVFLVLWLPSQL